MEPVIVTVGLMSWVNQNNLIIWCCSKSGAVTMLREFFRASRDNHTKFTINHMILPVPCNIVYAGYYCTRIEISLHPLRFFHFVKKKCEITKKDAYRTLNIETAFNTYLKWTPNIPILYDYILITTILLAFFFLRETVEDLLLWKGMKTVSNMCWSALSYEHEPCGQPKVPGIYTRVSNISFVWHYHLFYDVTITMFTTLVTISLYWLI